MSFLFKKIKYLFKHTNEEELNEIFTNENIILEKKAKYLKLLQENEELNEQIRKRQELFANLDLILNPNNDKKQKIDLLLMKNIKINNELSSSDASAKNTNNSSLTNTVCNNNNNKQDHFNFEIQVENTSKMKTNETNMETDF